MPRKKKIEDNLSSLEKKTSLTKEETKLTKAKKEEKPKKKKAENKPKTDKEKTKKESVKKEQKDEEEIKEKKERTEEEIEKLKEEVMKKAKKLAEKIEGEEDLKEKVKGDKTKSGDTLFPLDDYVKYSAHLGTKAVTPHMRQFVYKRRADGLAVLDTNSIDEKLKEGAEFLKDFAPEDVFIACKREAGWKAVKKFGEVTGIRVFTKKYPAGIITNLQLVDFFEAELVIICDPWLDKNALNDAVRVKVPVMGLCDTNNLTTGLKKVLPCNNKAAKSLGLILYLLAREYLKARGKEKESKELDIEDFTGVVEDREKAKESGGAKEGV